MRILTILLAATLMSLMTACKSTTPLTAIYQEIEIPAEPKRIDDVKPEMLVEPVKPELPAPGSYKASDKRAQILGAWAVELRKWGRSMKRSIEERQKASQILYDRQVQDRAAAKARLKALQDAENE